MLKRLIILYVLLLGVLSVNAQYDPSFSHYFDMEPSLNPASVGKQAKLNVTGAYAIDLAGYEHNPRTMYVSADMPFYLLKNYHGVGLQLMNDQIGLFTHQRLAAQYAFKRRLFGGMLSAGIQAGFISESFDGSKVDVEEGNDPALPKTKVNGNSVDIGAGVYYMHGAWYVGVSAQHLTSPKIELGETNEIDISPVYYLTGGYNIKLRNPFLSVRPSALVKYDGVAWRGDVSCRLVYTHEKKMLYGGVSYSPTNSVTGLIGGRFHGVVLGYSYEFYTSAISPGNGSHELFVGYQTDINLVKKGRNKHKSVRIL
nr:type IX secretion system membrane protein PorP/SprF [uncultured Prevotella sp.]